MMGSPLRSTGVLALAQALNLSAAVVSVTVSAQAANSVAPNPTFSTVPYGWQFAAAMVLTWPASGLMKTWGRKNVFMLGTGLLGLSGVSGFVAMESGQFALLCLAHALLGAYAATANFYRFAATDGLDEHQQASALSWVVAGGVLGALLGPWLADRLKSQTGFADFSWCYGSLSLLALLNLALLWLWTPQPTPATQAREPGTLQRAHRTRAWIAVLAAAWAYLAMNLLMVQASMHLQGLCSFESMSSAIQAHVLAMFLPSFFTGRMIRQLGAPLVILAGGILLVLACATPLWRTDDEATRAGLVLLGVGWNFLYVGGGALLATSTQGKDSYRWQGVNDTVIAVCATLGAFAPAPLFFLWGWALTNQMVMTGTGIVLLVCVWGLAHRQSA